MIPIEPSDWNKRTGDENIHIMNVLHWGWTLIPPIISYIMYIVGRKSVTEGTIIKGFIDLFTMSK